MLYLALLPSYAPRWTPLTHRLAEIFSRYVSADTTYLITNTLLADHALHMIAAAECTRR